MPAEDLAKIRAASNSAVFTQVFAPKVTAAILISSQTPGKAPSRGFLAFLRGLVTPRGSKRAPSASVAAQGPQAS